MHDEEPPPDPSWWTRPEAQASRAEFNALRADHTFEDPDRDHYEWLAYEARRRVQRASEKAERQALRKARLE